MANELDVKAVLEKILNSIYPVGSIYISTVATSPATLIGGTWTPIHGRFLVAQGSNGASGNQYLNVAAGSMSGEAKHTLSVSEMPKHRHNFGLKDWGRQGAGGSDTEIPTLPSPYTKGGGSNYCCPAFGNKVSNYTGISSRGDTIIWPNGGSAAHNNLPPYLAVYMWKRTG